MLAKRIQDLLKQRAPLALCDQCLARELGSANARVRPLAEAFGLTNDFTRVPAYCPGCGEQRPVTKAGGTQ